jgi:GNAT superfamily N-acetyltransferase
MIFEQIMEAEERGEIICPYFLRYHLRKNGQLTIYEIWVSPNMRYKGFGTNLLTALKKIEGATSIFAKCPIDLPANEWYKNKGFVLEGVEILKSGRRLNLWRLTLT